MFNRFAGFCSQNSWRSTGSVDSDFVREFRPGSTLLCIRAAFFLFDTLAVVDPKVHVVLFLPLAVSCCVLSPCFCHIEDAALLGRILAQQPESCIREMRFSTLGFGRVFVCVSLDPPQTVQMDQW